MGGLRHCNHNNNRNKHNHRQMLMRMQVMRTKMIRKRKKRQKRMHQKKMSQWTINQKIKTKMRVAEEMMRLLHPKRNEIETKSCIDLNHIYTHKEFFRSCFVLFLINHIISNSIFLVKGRK